MGKMMGLFRRKSSTKSASSSLLRLRKEPPTPAPPPPLPLPQTLRDGGPSDPSPSNGHSTPLSTFSSFAATDPQNSRSTVTLPSSVDDQDYGVLTNWNNKNHDIGGGGGGIMGRGADVAAETSASNGEANGRP